jgi:hypothetical protein
MRKLLMAAMAALAASTFSGMTSAPMANAAGCDLGYVVGVPMSDGRLPVKCGPRNDIPTGYVDGTGHGYAYRSGFKTDDGWYGHNGPCNSNDVTIIGTTPRGNAIERWGPKGCDPTLPMTGTN